MVKISNELDSMPVCKLVVTTQKTFLFAKETLVSVEFLIPLPLLYCFTFAFLVKREPKKVFCLLLSLENEQRHEASTLALCCYSTLQCVPKMS